MARAILQSNLSLFELPANLPEGFFYRPNFISDTEEQELINEIRGLSLVSFKYYQFTGKRRTASFGWQYEFGRDETPEPQKCRHSSCRSGSAQEIGLSSMATAWGKPQLSNIPSELPSAGIGTSHSLESSSG